ncbi:MAG: DUF4435 domain-containing protein, partial [Colwellia sp.]
MTNSLNQHADEIVTEISMSQSINPWLIVEGSTDGVFFSTRCLHGTPTTVVALGWENVTSVISKVFEESIVASVFGFIDRDYREELGIDIDEENIVVSDFRDLEVSLFESDALHRLLVEYGSTHKLPCMECGTVDISSVKQKIYLAASCIGRLRYYSLKEGLHYPIKKLDYSKFIDSLTLDIDKSKLIAQINSKSDTKIDLDILDRALNVELPQRLLDARNLCSGHDIVELLGMSLRRLWGSNNSGNVVRERLESSFRIGYSNEEFTKTDMFREL